MYAPLVEKNYLDGGTQVSWSTGITGELVGNSSATINITYYFSNGTTLTDSRNVTPSARLFNFDQRTDAVLSGQSSFIAAAVLTSSQSFSFIVNQVAGSSVLGDAAMTYGGVKP